jgi:two-component system, NtrC family, response regulator HydG
MKGRTPCLLLLDPEHDSPAVALPPEAPPWRWPGTGRSFLPQGPSPQLAGAGLRVDGARPAGAGKARETWEEGHVVQVGGRLGVVARACSATGSQTIEILGFVTASPEAAFAAAWAAVAGATGLDSLVLASTGAGKERLAQVLHQARRRNGLGGPFIAVNLGGMRPEVCTSELFGHERGAFTGALQSRPGAFRRADGGVLFLDELGEAAPEVQASLLRAVELGEVRPLGRSETVSVRVQVVAATNRAFGPRLTVDGVREDLVHRLAGTVIRLPPLCDRPEDVLPLALHILAQQARKGSPPAELHYSAEDLLPALPWPGNVRQLARVVTSAAVLCAGAPITARAIQRVIGEWPMQGVCERSHAFYDLDSEIRRAARMGPRQRSIARERLGVPKSTFYRKIRKLREAESEPSQDDSSTRGGPTAARDGVV